MGVGHHEAAWRHERTDVRNLTDVKHFQRLAQLAERGKLDSVFFADGLAVGPRVKHNTQAIFEPITLLTAMATVTERVGLIATATTGYIEPYTWPAASPPSITSAEAGPDGTSSPRRVRTRPPTSVSRASPTTPGAIGGPPNSSTWQRPCGTAGKTTPWSSTRPAGSSPIRTGSTASTTTASTSRSVAR